MYHVHPNRSTVHECKGLGLSKNFNNKVYSTTQWYILYNMVTKNHVDLCLQGHGDLCICGSQILLKFYCFLMILWILIRHLVWTCLLAYMLEVLACASIRYCTSYNLRMNMIGNVECTDFLLLNHPPTLPNSNSGAAVHLPGHLTYPTILQ